MWTAVFWKATAARAISTIVQVLIPLLVANRIDVIDPKATAWIAATAGVLSVLKALVAARVGNDGPSLISVESLAVEEPAA